MLSVGLVGLPNAGKSTLFNLLTKRTVPAENFPFCTIDPHDGIVEVPDSRVDTLAKLVNAQKTIKAAIEFRDIAGLVKGAAQGAGLGNQFLSHIREVDLILMVVRTFKNDDVVHVENRVNPQEDEEILMLELCAADQAMLEKMLPRFEKELKTSKDRLLEDKMNMMQAMITAVSGLHPASSVPIADDADKDLKKWRKTLNLLTDKPLLKLGNITDGENLPYNSDFNLDILLEASVMDMSKEERMELGLEGETGLDAMIQQCYKTLNLATYLTAGEKEARAWTFTQGSSAPVAAGKIHTDFEKKFIKANIMKYDDFVACEGWKNGTEQGKVKMVGKDYIMEDGDVVEFIIGN